MPPFYQFYSVLNVCPKYRWHLFFYYYSCIGVHALLIRFIKCFQVNAKKCEVKYCGLKYTIYLNSFHMSFMRYDILNKMLIICFSICAFYNGLICVTVSSEWHPCSMWVYTVFMTWEPLPFSYRLDWGL